MPLMLTRGCERGVKIQSTPCGESLEAGLLQLHHLCGALPKRALRILVEGRLGRIDALGPLEEPSGGALVGRGYRQVREILSRSVRWPGHEPGDEPDRCRGFAHQLRSHQAWVARVDAHLPSLRSARELAGEQQVGSLRGS